MVRQAPAVALGVPAGWNVDGQQSSTIVGLCYLNSTMRLCASRSGYAALPF